ncbi:lipopolysaccharide heptosyltransferase I [Propionivibrio limicola]|uniref:lipopolysaccharide heptosyltransferase I n=1 Tax=Propionivibrio limicola TaxID=167645 RepID=UPI001291C557|nr:lipopolysaccharide heptosyltransferase I [Propionivibrio limicola]
MRLLLVKTSSLGDVIHNLPVVSDLRSVFPDARIDWCVEESFADIPRLHPAVGDIIPVAIRRWRKALFKRSTWQEIGALKRRLGETKYDAILDTQGLIKSALLTGCASGRRYGYAAEVAREPLAAQFYDRTFVIPSNAHAVERNRWLSAAAFDYPVDLPLDYGIQAPAVDLPWLTGDKHAVLLTATSRDDKLWDEAHWITVARALIERGLTPVLPSGNARERERVERIVAAAPGALAAPPMRLHELAGLIGRAALAIGVDTGLVHLATALNVPTIALYITTDPALTGVHGVRALHNLGGPGHAPTPADVLALAERELRERHA